MNLLDAGKIVKSYLAFKLRKTSLTCVVYLCTPRCNLNCFFCNRWQIKTEEDDTAKSLAVIDKIAEAGVACISFNGGEPLMRKDLEILAEHARQKGLVLALSTNGTLLTKERAQKLGDYFESIAISLDGFEETHDQIRGQGTYKRAMKAIHLLKEYSAKAKVGIHFTLSRTNSAEIIPLFTKLHGKVDFASFAPVNPYPSLSGSMIPLDEIDHIITSLLALKNENSNNTILPPDQYIRALRQYYAIELEKKCHACELYCCVDWNGNLCLCPIHDRPLIIGSLHEAPLGQIIRGKKAGITELVNKCPGCMTTCTMLPSLLYEKSFLSGIALGTAMSWLKIR